MSQICHKKLVGFGFEVGIEPVRINLWFFVKKTQFQYADAWVNMRPLFPIMEQSK